LERKLNLVRYSFILLFLVSSFALRAQKTFTGGDFLMPMYWGNVMSNNILAESIHTSGWELHHKVEAKVWQFLSLVPGVNDGKLNKNDAKSDNASHKFSKLSFFSEIFKFVGFSQVCQYSFRLKNFISILIPFMHFSLSSYYFNSKMNLNFEIIAFQVLRSEDCGLEGFGPGYELWSEKGGTAGNLRAEIFEKCTTIAETRQTMPDKCCLENVNTCYVHSYEEGSVNGLLSAQLPYRTSEMRNPDKLLYCENGVKRVGLAKDFYSMSGISFSTHYQAHQTDQETGSLLKFSVSN
jgi:hypothetical protein